MIIYSICIQRCETKPSGWCISPWLAWRHTHVSPERKKLIYMIPNGPVLLFTSFLFFSIIIKEEKKGNFSSCVQRLSIFARAAWINMGMEHTQLALAAIYTHKRWFLLTTSNRHNSVLGSRLSIGPSVRLVRNQFFISYIAMKMSAFYEPQKYSFPPFFFPKRKRTVSFFFQLH